MAHALDERLFIERLTAMLRTLRNVKAFTTIYRILRTGREDVGDGRTLTEYLQTREYRVVLLHLAVRIGDPDLARAISRDLLAPTNEAFRESFDAYVDGTVRARANETAPRPAVDCVRFAKLVSELRDDHRLPDDFALHRTWLVRVRRLSFDPWIELGARSRSLEAGG